MESYAYDSINMHSNCRCQLLGMKPIRHLNPGSTFCPCVSTWLRTHSNYLSVPADTQPHLAFCVNSHTYLLLWWSWADRVKFDGKDKHDVIICSIPCGFYLLHSPGICSSCFLSMCETTLFHWGNSFYKRAKLGGDMSEFIIIGHKEGSKHSPLTMLLSDLVFSFIMKLKIRVDAEFIPCDVLK